MNDADNQVLLRGRVADAAEIRTLPSGDELVSFRLMVERSAAARRRSRQLVDTFDCSAWTSRLRGKALRLNPGDRVEVSGELRRLFSSKGGGVSSRVYVDLGSLTRLPEPPVASSA
ncbi:single-stranded DNA-binding protein [Aeromicrobium choanae]|uniref:Single-strand DNA-binding protein n=1 Tax=Aeromicrobium choanae TaxID=1736691 RepID=A0A1T4Z4V6_9ACTN|nr:single-stranded DNA-binding protein [Aeromicrobium choanae]SKB08585.1 single-strand DNA-binding protein [Aeromicrobium choanae]